MKNKRNSLYDATIRRNVSESLRKQEEVFSAEHENDSDEMLLHYLQKNAMELGHTPHEREILGGKLIMLRFGSWQTAICKAGLSPPTTPDKPSQFQRVMQEEQRQKALYAQKKAQKKEAARARELAREQKKRSQQKDQPGNPEIINEACP